MIFIKFFSVFVFGQLVRADAPPVKISLAVPIVVRNVDPTEIKYLEEWELYSAIHDSLLQYDAQAGFIPIMAEKWSYNTQKKTFTFLIKDKLKFSDGGSLNANDVAFSLKRVLFLDRDRSQALSRCLLEKNEPRPKPDQLFAKITVQNAQTVVLGPMECGEPLLNDLANANYAIVSHSATNSAYKIKAEHRPVSGLFVPQFIGDEVILRPNLNNTRWGTATNQPRPEVHVRQIAAFSKSNPPDLMRTTDEEDIKTAKALGYQTQISLPIMTWFLALDGKGTALEEKVVSDINLNLDRAKIPHFAKSSLEIPSRSFFPSDFNCNGKVMAAARAMTRNERQHIKLVIIDHPSTESKSFAGEVVALLNEAGYRAELRASSKEKKTNSHEVYFRLNRQFLGDGISNIIENLFVVMKTIPDTHGKILPLLNRLQREAKSTSGPLTSEICTNFSNYNHIPLAIRKYGLIAKSPALARLFSRVTGNLMLEEVPKLNLGER